MAAECDRCSGPGRYRLAAERHEWDRERGLVREGYWADLTVFDPARIAERATYDNPHQYPAGVSAVLVNGVVVIEAGEHSGALPGRVLRRGPHGVG
jgi:N-acyl-D-aspartate/D-glutamate deacylase